jgi:hypothetical protein
MQKDLVNLSDYKLNLAGVTQPSVLGSVENFYHEFIYEYKQIVESRHNHNCLSVDENRRYDNIPTQNKNQMAEILNQSFLEKDSRLVDICNMRFQTLLDLGVFVKKD